MAKEYTTFYGDKIVTDCLGCLPKDDPKLKGLQPVWSNGFFTLHQDATVPIPGFMILEATRHLKSILDFNPEELEAYFGQRLELSIRRAQKQALGFETVAIITDETSSHWHQWFLPHLPWMEQFGDPADHITEIFDHARKTMKNEETFKQIEEANKKLKKSLA